MTLKTTGWPPEKRARVAAMTKKQKPWKKSTGPKSDDGKQVASQNSYQHGYRSEEYRDLCALLRLQAQSIKNVLREGFNHE